MQKFLQTLRAKKKALLLSSWGTATPRLVQGLIEPIMLEAATYNTLITALTNHFAPQHAKMVSHVDFYMCQKKSNEMATDFMVDLC
ncbi:UNVERIFIED_CONTAM: hypothetical protein K2H54_073796 [Gekko kuhli]